MFALSKKRVPGERVLRGDGASFGGRLHWGGHCGIVLSWLRLLSKIASRATSSVSGRSFDECLRGIVVPLFARGTRKR